MKRCSTAETQAARLAGSVRGLGVCDALRVELAPVQRAGLAEQLAQRAAVLERRLAGGPGSGEERPAAREELAIVASLRAALPARAVAPFVLTGPAGVVLELVGACLTAALADVAVARPSACAQLEAAAAWLSTALDCHAVEAFSFEPPARVDRDAPVCRTNAADPHLESRETK